MLTFSPQVLKALDSDLEKATKLGTFPVVLLREALSVSKPYLGDPKDSTTKPVNHNLQLYGEEAGDGNGYLHGCTMNKASLFFSEGLKGKPLFVYCQRVPLLVSFLSKSTGDVDVYQSTNATYFRNAADQVLGWSNQDYVGVKFGYHNLTLDRHIFKIPRANLEKELRYVRSTLPAERDKVSFSYDHSTACLRVGASNPLGGEIESLPLAVTPLVQGQDRCWGPGDLGTTESLQFNVNLDNLIQIVESTKHPRDVVLGVGKTRKQSQHLIRTIEDYSIDEQGKYVERPGTGQRVFECRAQRYISSKQ